LEKKKPVKRRRSYQQQHAAEIMMEKSLKKVKSRGVRAQIINRGGAHVTV